MGIDYQQVLYHALADPIGLLCQTSDQNRARQRLYTARAKAGDQALAGLQIRLVDLPDGNLAIVNEKIDLTRREPSYVEESEGAEPGAEPEPDQF